uniref:Uncharacterized protein n=1 Tax=Anopheles albimanus TaxID=7167 RepID=A0A182FYB2_ANOAL
MNPWSSSSTTSSNNRQDSSTERSQRTGQLVQASEVKEKRSCQLETLVLACPLGGDEYLSGEPFLFHSSRHLASLPSPHPYIHADVLRWPGAFTRSNVQN